MAVIESKGDGYSLYNGVKLPNIDAVWDKEIYPYVVIDYDGYFYNSGVIATTEPYTYNGTKFVCSGKMCLFGIDGATDTWDLVFDGGNAVKRSNLIWANTDILNTTDNSVYLAASEPISLDGMNVIEWDGDTTGLETPVGVNAFYRVSSATDLDTGKTCYMVPKMKSGALGSVAVVTATEQAGYYQISQTRYAPVDNDIYDVGVYFARNVMLTTVLFAYYPIEEEPEEPDGEPIDPKSMLMGWLVGRWIAAQRVKKEPVAYLYNGVRLPDINVVWDKETYPYCIIVRSINTGEYRVVFSDSAFYSNGGRTTKCNYNCCSYNLIDLTWELHMTGSNGCAYLHEIHSLVFASHDIVDIDDNSVYFKASEPIPVYE